MTLHIVQTLPMCALVLILLCLATERHGVTQIRVLRQWDPHIIIPTHYHTPVCAGQCYQLSWFSVHGAEVASGDQYGHSDSQ